MTTPATEMGIEPLVERVARAIQHAILMSPSIEGDVVAHGLDDNELCELARAAIAAFEATRTPEAAQVEELLERHIQRCRDAVAESPQWSSAQAEWSRAGDALLNFRDDLAALAQVRHPSGEQS